MGSYWDTEALRRQLRLCEQVGFEFAFESLKSMTGSNASRQRAP